MNEENKFLKQIYENLNLEESQDLSFDQFKLQMSDRDTAKGVYDRLSDNLIYGESAIDQEEFSFDDFYQATDINSWYRSSDEETRNSFLESNDIDASNATVFDYYDFTNNSFDLESVRQNDSDAWLDFVAPGIDHSSEQADLYLEAYDPNKEGDVRWDVEALRDFTTSLDFARQEASRTLPRTRVSSVGEIVPVETKDDVENRTLATLFQEVGPGGKAELQSIDAIKNAAIQADDLEKQIGLEGLANQGSQMAKAFEEDVSSRVERFKATERYKNAEKELRVKIGKVSGSNYEPMTDGGGTRRVNVVYDEAMLQEDLSRFVEAEMASEVAQASQTIAQQWMQSNGGASLSDEQKTQLSDYYYKNWGLDLALDGDNRYQERGVVKDFMESFELGMNNYFMNPLSYALSGFDEEERLYGVYYNEVKRSRMTAFGQNMTQSLTSGNFQDFFRQQANMLAESAPLMLAASVPGGAGIAGLALASVGAGISDFASKKTIDEERVSKGLEPIYDDDTERTLSAVGTGVGEFAMGTVGRGIQGLSGGVSFSGNLAARTSASRAAFAQAGGLSSSQGRSVLRSYVSNRLAQFGVNVNSEGFEEVFAEAIATGTDVALGVEGPSLEEFGDSLVEAWIGGAGLGVGFDGMGSLRNSARVDAQSRVDIVTGTSETMVQLKQLEDRIKNASPDQLSGLQKQKTLLESRRQEELDARSDWWLALSFADKKSYDRLKKLNLQYVEQVGIANDTESVEANDRDVAAKKAESLLSKAREIQESNADINTKLTPEQNQKVAISTIASREAKLAADQSTLESTIEEQQEAGDKEGLKRSSEMLNEFKDRSEKLKSARVSISTLTKAFETSPTKETWDRLLDARLEAAELMNTKTDVVHGKFATTKFSEAKQIVEKGAIAMESKGVSASWSASAQVKDHKADPDMQGSTFKLDGTNAAGQPGSSVSIFPERSEVFDGELTEEKLEAFKEANKDLLDGNGDILAIGTWFDAKSGQTYLDISSVVDEASAVELGKQYNQKSVFNLQTFEEVDTGGDGTPLENAKSEEERVSDIRSLVSSKQPEATSAEAVDPSSSSLSGGIEGQYADITVGGEVSAFTEEQLPDLSKEELGFLNTVVKALSDGNNVRVHLSKESGDLVEPGAGGIALIGQGIHLIPDQILANASKETKGVKKLKSFQETVLEEVGHMLTTKAIQSMPANERSVLTSELERIVGRDSSLAKRGLVKVKSYSTIDLSSAETISDVQGLIESSSILSKEKKEELSAQLHDEYIQEIGAGVAMDPSLRKKVKIGQFLRKLFRALGFDVNLNQDSAMKLLDGYVGLKKGKSFSVSDVQLDSQASSDLSSGRASKGISPARLPESGGFTVSFQRSKVNRFGEEMPATYGSKTFNGKWDFVKWWNYTTLKGTGPVLLFDVNLKNTDGSDTRIDVDSMMKWKLRKPQTEIEKMQSARERFKHRAHRRVAAIDAAQALTKATSKEGLVTYYESVEAGLKMLNIPIPEDNQGKPLNPVDLFNSLSTKDYDAIIAASEYATSALEGKVSRESKLIDVAAAKKNGRISESESAALMSAAKKLGADVHDIQGMTEEEFEEVKNIQLCGIGNSKGCGASSRISNQEYKRVMAAETFGISVIDENAPEEKIQELVDRHSDFYVEDLTMALEFVRENSDYDPLDFYEDTRAAAGRFIEDVRSNLARTGSVSAKAAADIKGLEDLFMTVLAVTSNRSTAEPNVELATAIFYESILNYNLNTPNEFISPSIIKALMDDKNSRHEEFDRFVSPLNPMGVKNMGKMLLNFNKIISENITSEGKIDVKAIKEKFMEIDPSTGRQRIERLIGIEAPKIGTFATNLMDVSASGQFVTQDLHVGDYMSASVGSEVRSLDDKIMQATGPSRSGTKKAAILGRAGIKESDSPKDRINKLSQLKAEALSSEDRTALGRVFKEVFGEEIGRDQGPELKRKGLRDRILSLTADKINKSGRLDTEVTPAALGQVMYAYNQLRENPMAKRRAPKKYTPYAPVIDSVIAEGSYRDLSRVDARRFVDEKVSSIESVMQPNVMEPAMTASQEKALERQSQLLIPFNRSNSEPATESKLYRQRSWEEVNGLSVSGQEFSFGEMTEVFEENPAVGLALQMDATSARIMAKNKSPMKGDKVGVRLNLNVKKNTGIPVQTLHQKSASGEALAYSPAVIVKDVNLFVNQNARKKIATFQENKFPMASVDGSFETSTMSEVVEGGFDGVKAVFNPLKSPYFTDVAGRPIKGASEATVFGNVVYLRGEIDYYDSSDKEIQASLKESDAEREKRIKRGPKYDKAIKRYASFMNAQGITFDSAEALKASYDSMPLKSSMALSESEYVSNLEKEENLIRASRVITPKDKRKARRFNKRASAKFEGARADILSNPEAYITKQKLAPAREKLEAMDTSDLVSIMTDESLGRLSMRNDDMSVLAGIELINRSVARGEYDQVASIVDELGKIGTTAGRVLRHFGELKTSTPKGLAKVIETAVEAKGNSLSEKQKARLQSITEEYITKLAQAKELMKQAIAGEDVGPELEGATRRLKLWERQLESFANSVIERDWGTLAKMMIQGNLLTSMSQFTNVVANMFNASLIIPRDLLALPVEKALNFLGFSTHMPKRKISLQAYMYGIRKFGSGFIESIDEIATGQGQDVTEWRMHRGFAPFRSIVSAIKGGEELPLGKEGSKAREMFGPRSLSQRAKLFAQGTLGVPAETMFRLLGIGDTPFRRMVEGIELYNKGLEKGLEGEELRKYIKYPPTQDREAAEREGRKLTFQEDTAASRAAENLIGLLENTLGSVVVRSQIPYIRTPVNIVVETLTYTSPIIGVARIYKDLSKNDTRAAAENIAKVTMGGMIKFAAGSLLKNGLVSGPVDYTDDKEKNLMYAEFPPNSINVTGLQRLMDGGDPGRQPDDYFISYQKLGVPGAIIGAMAQTYNESDVDEESPATTVLRDAFGVSALSTIAVMMEQSFLAGVNAFTELLSASGDSDDFERKLERWLDSTFRALSSIPMPNQLSVFSKMAREHMPDMRIDKNLPLEQRLLKRFEYVVRDRSFNTDGIPVRVNWKGEPIDQTPRGSTAPDVSGYYLFDVMKARQGDGDPVSSEVWNLYEDTQEIADVVSTPYYAKLRKMKAPYPRTKKEKKAFEEAGLNFSYLDDEEFMSQTHRMSVVQANRVLAVAGKQRYIESEQLIGTEEYLKSNSLGRLEMLNDLNKKYSGVKEMDENGAFRSHTLEIMKIMQEIYEYERREED
jgi:hypothetical protein